MQGIEAIMDNEWYRRNDIRDVGAVCRAIVVLFVALDALYVLVSLIAKGNPGSLGVILLGLVFAGASAGVLFLHFSNDTIRISESGIEKKGCGNIEWQDVSRVTITSRAHAGSGRVDTIICIFHGRRGVFKISSSPEDTAQILLLLKRYVEDRLFFDETHA
jgi:hypothetical protein